MLSFGQVSKYNTRAITSKTISSSNVYSIKSKSMKAFENEKVSSASKNVKLEKISMPSGAMEKQSSKTWKITPIKPITTGLEFTFNGYYSKQEFRLNPRLAANNSYFLYSGHIYFNARKGKEYRVKILTDNKDEYYYGEVTVDIGGKKTATINHKNTSINFVFSAEQAGYLSIPITPVNIYGRSPRPLKIKLIQIDEI